MSERKLQTKSKKMSKKARRYECKKSEEKTADGPPHAEKAETKCREGTSHKCETKSKKMSKKARRYLEEKTAEEPPHAEKDKAETKCTGATSQECETRSSGRLSAISKWWRGIRSRGGRRRRDGRVADIEEMSPALTEQSTSATPEDLPGPSSASGSKTHGRKYAYESREDESKAASQKDELRPTMKHEDRKISFWQKFKRLRKNKVTPYREPEEEEPPKPKKKSSIKINKVSDEPGFRQEFLCSTIDIAPVPEPLPETPVIVAESRRRPTRRLAALDQDYHSTLVSMYDK